MMRLDRKPASWDPRICRILAVAGLQAPFKYDSERNGLGPRSDDFLRCIMLIFPPEDSPIAQAEEGNPASGRIPFRYFDGAEGGTYALACEKLSATCAQLTVFHHASMYSGRRF